MYIKNASTTVARLFLLPYTISLTGPPTSQVWTSILLPIRGN